MSDALRAGVLLALCIMAQGCGQAGPLYLPDSDEASENASGTSDDEEEEEQESGGQ